MLNGFQKIIEERIQKAQQSGEFDNLSGIGEPLAIEDVRFVPEDTRLAYKILKNADCVPPEIEMKNEIFRIESMLAEMEGSVEKYRLLKKLNLLIMKLNLTRNTSIKFEMPQQYEAKLVDRFDAKTHPEK